MRLRTRPSLKAGCLKIGTYLSSLGPERERYQTFLQAAASIEIGAAVFPQLFQIVGVYSAISIQLFLRLFERFKTCRTLHYRRLGQIQKLTQLTFFIYDLRHT